MIEQYYEIINPYILLLSSILITQIMYFLFAFFSGGCEEGTYNCKDNSFTSTTVHRAIPKATLFGKTILYPIWATLYVYQWSTIPVVLIITLPFFVIAIILSLFILSVNRLMWK